jgi:hypothetical protein
MLPKAGLGEAPTPPAMAAYLAIWGCFTGIMFISTPMLNRALQAIFLTLTILFFLLATDLAQVLNEVHGRTMWPLGPVS